MGWDPAQWSWIEHLAVWPLATLVVGIVFAFGWLAITDPTLPDEGPDKERPVAVTVEAGGDGTARHRA